VTDEEALLMTKAYAAWLEGRGAVRRHEVSILRRMAAGLRRRRVPRWRLGRATADYIHRTWGGWPVGDGHA